MSAWHGPSATSPSALLGSEHPLTRAERRAARCRLALGVGVLGVLPPGAAFAAGLDAAQFALLAGAGVLAGLALAALLAQSAVRRAAIQAIAEGYEGLEAPSIRMQRRRLLRPATRRRLARSLDELAMLAWSPWHAPARSFAPRVDPLGLRHLRPHTEALRVASALLATDDMARAQGAAACERLLTCSGSPIWGNRTETLAGELGALHEALEASLPPAR